MNEFKSSDLQLALTAENLTNPDLIALAWKKAHHYIRSTNWYADNFELDKSALDLHDACAAWAKEIERGKIDFNAFKLVPAPKTQVWHFVPSGNQSDNQSCLEWHPKIKEVTQGSREAKLKKDALCKSEKPNQVDDDNDYPVKLRPLAHIGIKEQTIMTLVMMCLANLVETQQGDPSTDYEEAHAKKSSAMAIASIAPIAMTRPSTAMVRPRCTASFFKTTKHSFNALITLPIVN